MLRLTTVSIGQINAEDAEWRPSAFIDPSPHDANTAYVAVDRHKLDDFNRTFSKRQISEKIGAQSLLEFPMAPMCTLYAKIPSAKVTLRGN